LYADQGNILGCYRYSLCLEHGTGVKIDLSQAAHYQQLAIGRGDGSGERSYAACFEQGDCVDRDLGEVAHHYKLSADQGNASDEYSYGFFLEHGIGVKIDLQMAAHYYQLSADQGNAMGQYNYGLCLEQGRGVSQNAQMGARYFELSARQGNEAARQKCERYFPNSDDRRLRRDSDGEGSAVARSVKSWADNGNSRVTVALSHLLDNSLGAPISSASTVGYHERLWDCSPRACACHGWCLQHGIHVPVNFTEAAEMFQRAP
jgi:TPR repeat protein